MLSPVAAILSFLVLSPHLAFASESPSESCKCTAGQRCWPSTAEWAALSKTLTHPVFDVHPPGYYCHNPNFNAALCATAQANRGDSIWRADQPGAEESDNWEFTATSECDINGNRTTPCGQGRVPSVGVNATSVKDIQKALEFAHAKNLKVHVKNTGHDFLGRGLGPGSLMIWTHKFKFLEFSRDFVYSTGQKSGFPTITVGPGIQWVDAYAFAAANNVAIAGGIGPSGSVGAGGGWPLGGGHNIISPALGLGADNVLELDLVLPNGTLVTANPHTHSDLFWAARGGGGPSFGIATSVTYKAHPITPLYASFYEATTNGTDAFISLLDTWHAALPALADAGWSGYYPFQNGSYFALMYLLPNGTPAKGNATLGPFLKAAAAIPGVTVKTDATATYPNFQSWFIANILDPVDVVGFNYTGGAVAGLGVDTASWLLPRKLFTDATDAHAMSVAMSRMPAGIAQHVGGGVVSQEPADFNALHPAWREALVDVTIYGVWTDDASGKLIKSTREGITNLLAPLRALTPNGGQYLNEPDLLVPNYPSANWGSHYERLLRVKASVDPTNMLLVTQGVGAVGWDSEQICRISK
ncbi:FAD-binding domain-containing protein [Mycena vulgaris]|nr:FAD-binding domain-containing protein [Mycena vulgaris]